MHALSTALGVTWSPFVLVAGLLLVGHVSAEEGLFRHVGDWCARVPGGGIALYCSMMAAVAMVTAVLNLDTAVVFMTPVALHAARAKGTDTIALAYGTIFMSNSASLLLVGSNLTNLLVVSGLHETGGDFVRHTGLAWFASVVVTASVVLLWRLGPLRRAMAPTPTPPRTLRPGPGLVAIVGALAAMLLFANPALVVLAIGVAVTALHLARRAHGGVGASFGALHPRTIASLYVVATLVSWFAHATSWIHHLLRHASVVTTAAAAAGASVVINNLPAAALMSAHRVAHPFALVVGLDVGPNAVVTGALSSLLWWRIARRHGVRTSVATFSAVGVIVAALSIACAIPLVA